jgi:PAS domain S-box-containing protein
MEKSKQNNSTILIVDDKPGAREVLRGLLTGEGYNLVYASSGQEALAKAVELVPDLILLDVMMPGMNGFEVCEQLRANSTLAEVPVIMVTALDDLNSRLQGIEVGADDFVTKPFDHTELRARVRTITRLNRYRRLLSERTQRQQAETEARRRNYELTLLNQIITAASSTLNVLEILGMACQSLANAFEMPHATAWLLQERPQFVNVDEYMTPLAALEHAKLDAGQVSGQDEDLSEATYLIDLILERLSESQAPLAMVDEPTDSRLIQFYHLMQANNLGSLLIVPIQIGDQITGIVELGSIERHNFSSQDLTLAQSIATAIGQAMETAQLYQDLQAHVENLEKTVAQRTHELQNERDRTRSILEALGEAVVVTDVAGKIQYLNPAAVNLTGFSEEEVKGQDWRLWQCGKTGILTINEVERRPYDEILTVARRGQIWQGEVNNKRKDGTRYEAMITMAPLFDPKISNQIVGFASVQSDITLLKEAERIRTIDQEREKQRVALDRLRHTFLSTINHEMRTPLSLIFQSIEMLESFDLGELTERQLDALTALRRQAWTLGEMVEGLTRVAAFLSKQEAVRPVLAQLEPVFDSLLPLAEFKARSKEITVEADIAPDLPLFPLDVKQMEEALTQLVDNAIKFNQAGGKVTIKARSDDEWVAIAISDTGIGIEAELMDRIWEVFEQGVDPLRRAQEGLGLGLVLARYIVEAHNGTIEIETTPSQGSTFTVRLPRQGNNG